MTITTPATKCSLFLALTAFLLLPIMQVAQQAEGSASTKLFAGTWKGICGDGAEFVVLTLSQSGNEMVGTISIANMSGPKGRCNSVVDPPTDGHAMKIHDTQMQGKALAFKGSGKTAFEMSVTSADEASLKFLGTPVEDNPWKLKRVK